MRMKRSDSKSLGRADWSKLRSTSAAEIEAQAQAERAELGIDPRRLRFYRVLNLRTPDIKKIRQRLRLSQAQFSDRFGFSVRTLQQWEQGRAEPDQPARLLLSLIELSPAKIGLLVDAVAAHAARRTAKSTRRKITRKPRSRSGTT
jgi:putative transcriptional regulator